MNPNIYQGEYFNWKTTGDSEGSYQVLFKEKLNLPNFKFSNDNYSLRSQFNCCSLQLDIYNSKYLHEINLKLKELEYEIKNI